MSADTFANLVERAFAVRADLGRKARRALTDLEEVAEEVAQVERIAADHAAAERDIADAKARLRALYGKPADPALVRSWARERGIPVAVTGPVPAEIVRLWQEGTQ